MVLEGILEKLHAERERLTKELDRVTRMIRAAGKGAQAAVKEYGRQQRRTVRKRTRTATPGKKVRKLSQATVAKMKKAQRERRKREKAGTKPE